MYLAVLVSVLRDNPYQISVDKHMQVNLFRVCWFVTVCAGEKYSYTCNNISGRVNKSPINRRPCMWSSVCGPQNVTSSHYGCEHGMSVVAGRVICFFSYLANYQQNTIPAHECAISMYIVHCMSAHRVLAVASVLERFMFVVFGCYNKFTTCYIHY